MFDQRQPDRRYVTIARTWSRWLSHRNRVEASWHWPRLEVKVWLSARPWGAQITLGPLMLRWINVRWAVQHVTPEWRQRNG